MAKKKKIFAELVIPASEIHLIQFGLYEQKYCIGIFSFAEPFESLKMLTSASAHSYTKEKKTISHREICLRFTSEFWINFNKSSSSLGQFSDAFIGRISASQTLYSRPSRKRKILRYKDPTESSKREFVLTH